MTGEWSDTPVWNDRCWDLAGELTRLAGGQMVIEPGVVGWRLRPGPGSGYPAIWAITLSGLYRRLAAAATPRQPCRR